MSKPTSYSMSGSTADGAIVSPDMTTYLERGYISILFYTDSTLQTPASPTAGSVVFDASETGADYGEVNDGVIDLSMPMYTRPTFAGPIKKVRATFSGVVDGGYFVATIAKYGGI